MTKKAKEPSSLAVLFRIPIFRRLWSAITVSSLGDWLGLLATTSLAAYLTKSSSGLAQGAAVSGVLLVRLAPDLILGPIAGALVDKIDRRKIAYIGDTLAGLLYVSIAVGGNLTWLLIAQFLVEAVGLFTNPAKQAMWVNIVPRERLAVANQLNYVSIYGMVPIAAAIFALLSTVSQFFGATQVTAATESTSLVSGPTSAVAINIALLLDALTYFFAAGMVFLSRRMIPAFVGEREVGKSIFSLIAEGISFVKNSKIMRAIYIGILGAFGAGGLTAGVALLYVSSLGAGSAGYGILFGSVFTGLALGMLIGPRVLPTIPRRMIFTFAIGAAGLVLILMSLLQDFVGAVIAASVMGLFAGIAWITGFTMIGHEVSDQLRGRVFAFVMSSVRITLLATIAVGPVVAGAIGSHSLVIGNFRLDLSGAGIVLACGGVIAVLVSLYASRQVGGLAGGLLRRVLGGRRPDLLRDEADYLGALIALEGADRLAVADYAAALHRRISADGWRVHRYTGLPAVVPRDENHAVALRSAADLSELVSGSIRPELDQGSVVICTDYVDAAVVRYGLEAGLGDEQVLRMALWAVDGLRPDLTILVDPAPAGTAGEPASGLPLVAEAEFDRTAAEEVAADLASQPAGPPEDAEPFDAVQAYRDRASSAPERYLIVHPLDGPDPAPTDEVVERVASVLRQRSPAQLIPVGPATVQTG